MFFFSLTRFKIIVNVDKNELITNICTHANKYKKTSITGLIDYSNSALKTLSMLMWQY